MTRQQNPTVKLKIKKIKKKVKKEIETATRYKEKELSADQ